MGAIFEVSDGGIEGGARVPELPDIVVYIEALERAGGPALQSIRLWAWQSGRVYHCGTSWGSIEGRRVPQVRCV